MQVAEEQNGGLTATGQRSIKEYQNAYGCRMAREILWPDRLNTKRAAAYLDLAYDTLVQWRKKDVGPAYHKFGRLVVYTKNDLDQWISRCRVNGAAFGNKRPPRLIPDQDAV